MVKRDHCRLKEMKRGRLTIPTLPFFLLFATHYPLTTILPKTTKKEIRSKDIKPGANERTINDVKGRKTRGDEIG